jgi:hypothetical protein
MLDIQSGTWIEITFIEGYEPKCTLSNILYGIMYRFRVVALNDAGSSDPGDPSDRRARGADRTLLCADAQRLHRVGTRKGEL